MTALSDQEWEFRRRRYEQLRAQVSDRLEAAVVATHQAREPGRAEAQRIIGAFGSGGPVEDLRSDLDQWSRGARNWGFAGPNGAMISAEHVEHRWLPANACELARSA